MIKSFSVLQTNIFPVRFCAPPPNSPRASAAATTQNDQENSFFHSADSFRKNFFNYDARYQQSQLKLILFTFSFKIKFTKCVNIFELMLSSTECSSTFYLNNIHPPPLNYHYYLWNSIKYQGKTLSRHLSSSSQAPLLPSGGYYYSYYNYRKGFMFWESHLRRIKIEWIKRECEKRMEDKKSWNLI